MEVTSWILPLLLLAAAITTIILAILATKRRAGNRNQPLGRLLLSVIVLIILVVATIGLWMTLAITCALGGIIWCITHWQDAKKLLSGTMPSVSTDAQVALNLLVVAALAIGSYYAIRWIWTLPSAYPWRVMMTIGTLALAGLIAVAKFSGTKSAIENLYVVPITVIFCLILYFGVQKIMETWGWKKPDAVATVPAQPDPNAQQVTAPIESVPSQEAMLRYDTLDFAPDKPWYFLFEKKEPWYFTPVENTAVSVIFKKASDEAIWWSELLTRTGDTMLWQHLHLYRGLYPPGYYAVTTDKPCRVIVTSANICAMTTK